MPGILYGLYAWTLFVLLATASLPLLLLTPGLLRRRALVRTVGRWALTLTALKVSVHGLEHIPGPCIVVANHASYLDGVIMQAVLPPDFSFVIKREMSSVPLAGFLLRRIGAEFVERQNRAGGARDARRLLRQAASGKALVFFPEGTISPSRGLMRFHIGAFAAAARAGLPVVPVAIRGTRTCLPLERLLPRAGRIEVQILPAVHRPELPPGEREADQAMALRDAARASMLAALGEPDLAVAAASDGQHV